MASLPSILGGLDPTSDRAVFRQIADQLREAIDRGRFKEGRSCPPRLNWSSTTGSPG